MPHMFSPTMAFRRKSFPIGTPASLPTSLVKCAAYLELSKTSQQHTIRKPMVKAKGQTSPWNSTYDCTAALIKRTGQLGYRWPSIHGTSGLMHPPKIPVQVDIRLHPTGTSTQLRHHRPQHQYKNANNPRRKRASARCPQTSTRTHGQGTKFKGFEIGNKVWLEGKNIKRPYDSPKLSPKRYGPFRVVTKISPMAYKIQILATWQVHNVFHASLLTPYKETVEHGENFLEPPPDIIEGEEEWEVEQVLGKCHFGRGKQIQYLVRWKGYSPAHDQWINKEDMAANDLVRIFERENRNTPEQHPTRSNRIRATTVDFDSPEIASSREASVEPMDMDILAAWARTKRTHWAQSLDQKERT